MKFKKKAEKMIDFLKREDVFKRQEIMVQEDELLFLHSTLLALKNANGKFRAMRKSNLKEFMTAKALSRSGRSASQKNISVTTSEFKEFTDKGKKAISSVKSQFKGKSPRKSNSERRLNLRLKKNGSTTDRLTAERSMFRRKEKSLDKFAPNSEDIINEEEPSTSTQSFEKVHKEFFGLKKRLEARKKLKYNYTSNNGNRSTYTIPKPSESQMSLKYTEKTEDDPYYSKNCSIITRLKKITSVPKIERIPLLNLKKKSMSPLFKQRIHTVRGKSKRLSNRKLSCIKSKNNPNFMRKKSLQDIINPSMSLSTTRNRVSATFRRRSKQESQSKSGEKSPKKYFKKRFQIKIRDSPIKYGRVTTNIQVDTPKKCLTGRNFENQMTVDLKVKGFDGEVRCKPRTKQVFNFIHKNLSSKKKKIELDRLEKELLDIHNSLDRK